MWYQRCAASCSQHPGTQCQPCSCIPGRTPSRCLSTASPRHPPRRQVRGFGGKKLLTHFLTYISQLPVSFTINENPQERPNGVPPTTHRGPSLCLFCLHPWIFFSSADPKLPKLVTPHCLLKYRRVLISSSCHGDDKGTLPMLQ